MNTSENDKCRSCGAVIPTKSTETLCPACLMSGALNAIGSKAETVLLTSDDVLPDLGTTEFPRNFGEYRLLGLLGRGGMGAVYEAEQIATGRRVALKMLGHQLDTSDMRQRFLREGRLAARVNHPNSLFIFGSEEIEGLPVITMEIAAGGTLKDKLKARGPLPVTEAVDAILDVISGLESAYAVGVLHRDIKPSNCFVCPDGSVKVGDFGLSVSTLSKTDTFVTAHGMIMGTPAFASPEQLRGDTLDIRADIYSVAATLYTLLTNRAPFEGDNAVQVVANAVNQDPKPLSELRKDVPPGLERIVARCLAKAPDGRYGDYTALRNALLPFSSRVPEPASMAVRVPAGWIDYLIAFLPPYVVLMFLVGGEEMLIQPLIDRTLYSARYYLAIFSFGFLYFSIAEGIWGAGLGKRLKGLCVVRANGRRPGLGRALVRILIPLLSIEGVRIPLLLAVVSGDEWTGFHTLMYVVSSIVFGWIPVLFTLCAGRKNGFATVWDLASGTRVVIKAKGTVRPSVEPVAESDKTAADTDLLGPYQIIEEVDPGAWIVAADPVLRRRIWLLRRTSAGLSPARQNVARAGRLRWLQKVEAGECTWDAFEAAQGVPFSTLVKDGKQIPWGTLRHWLHDLSSELWESTGDQTLPAELSLDHVWITGEGQAILLDAPWPDVRTPATRIPVGHVAGQQRFLDDVAACVESTSLPLHARPVLQNLKEGKFEKLSFLAGTLRGLLDRPAEVSRGVRAGSIFMLPLYIWIAFVVGRYHDKEWHNPAGIIVLSALGVLGVIALVQLLALPTRGTASLSIFRLAVVNAKGGLATVSRLLVRWAIVWLPLFLPMSVAVLLINRADSVAFIPAVVVLLLWIAAAVYAVIHPNRGLHDRLVGTWVVRR